MHKMVGIETLNCRLDFGWYYKIELKSTYAVDAQP